MAVPSLPQQCVSIIADSKVRNVCSSVAGAGSGDFHTYRHLRGKEMARQAQMEKEFQEQKEKEEYEQYIKERDEKISEKLSRRQAKRKKKKEKKKEFKVSPNQIFKNDGSFLEIYKKYFEEQQEEKKETSINTTSEYIEENSDIKEPETKIPRLDPHSDKI